ncbi:unnamed protein product [Mytilus edulis]|uniref:Uncharacterized protein n=1 Tax=Mytilus edulis TaxID=6550 RepID=A0A8S3SMG1_MYTED|nr:unnamed protein product [Mytilus edulis]
MELYRLKVIPERMGTLRSFRRVLTQYENKDEVFNKTLSVSGDQGVSGGSCIPSDTSRAVEQPKKCFERDHLEESALLKKQKKGDQAGACGSLILSEKTKVGDQSKKKVERAHFEERDLPKKKNKGEDVICPKTSVFHRKYLARKCKKEMPLRLQKTRTARHSGKELICDSLKTSIVNQKYIASKCRRKMSLRLQKSQTARHSEGTSFGGQADGSSIKLTSSPEGDKQKKRFRRNQLEGNTVSKKHKKGTSFGGQADGSSIKLSSSPEGDKPKKRFRRNQLERNTVSKKHKKGTTYKCQDLSFKNKLLLAIQDENEDMCKNLMANSQVEEILQVLSAAVKKALSTNNDGIKKEVFSKIAKNSADVIKKFRKSRKSIPENAIIWMGTHCTCDKTSIKRYKDLPCLNTLPEIVVEMNESEVKSDATEEFFGFSVRVINLTTDKSEDNEAKTVLKNAVGKSNGCIVKHEIHASIAKHLFNRHSNLTMVCPSKWKSTGFNQKQKHKVDKIDCINLFCKTKGIVPIGEHHFPQKIQGFPTDVLNGTSYLTGKLKIGDTINNSYGTGTLGGFVKYYGTDTFLTCAHVIFGKDNLLDLEKEKIHFMCRKMKNNGSEPVECILIRHALKFDTVNEYNTSTEIEEMDIEEPYELPQSQQTNVPETSVDAALLLIQIPTDMSNTMVNLKLVLNDTVSSTRRNLKRMGIKSIYLNENALPNPDVVQSNALSLSAITGEQRGNIQTKKVKELVIRYSTHVRLPNNIQMYNQLTIENMDFQPGDSGTCIYAICPRNKDSGCIGMFIGKSTSGQLVVTPIDEILKALGVH